MSDVNKPEVVAIENSCDCCFFKHFLLVKSLNQIFFFFNTKIGFSLFSDPFVPFCCSLFTAFVRVCFSSCFPVKTQSLFIYFCLVLKPTLFIVISFFFFLLPALLFHFFSTKEKEKLYFDDFLFFILIFRYF